MSFDLQLEHISGSVIDAVMSSQRLQYQTGILCPHHNCLLMHQSLMLFIQLRYIFEKRSGIICISPLFTAAKFAVSAQSAINYRQNMMGFFAILAQPRQAVITLTVSAVLFVGAAYLASERHVGDLHAGAPELRPEARYNKDITEITKRYNVTTDVLVVIPEVGAALGINPCRSTYVVEAQDNLHWYLENIDGVTKVISLSSIAKRALSGYAEGNLKWTYLPHNERALSFATSVVDPSTGLINEACSIMPIYVFTEDHKATTISHIIHQIEDYNQKFRELEDTITFRVLIQKPSDKKYKGLYEPSPAPHN